MTLSDSILALLDEVRVTFYADKSTRIYCRDERALLKSISRYGHECVRRGWFFDARAIKSELVTLLRSMAKTKAHPEYLPIYLEAAVDSHVRVRAEELSESAKRIAPKVSKIVRTTQGVVAVVAPSDAEVLATVYRDLAKAKSGRRSRHRAPAQRLLPL